MIDEEAQTIRVKLKPVFEHLRQLKLQDKGCFTAEIKNLDGTLKSRSDRAKQTLNNEHSDVNELEDYGTRKKLLNTKIEPHLDGSIKNNVEKVTILEPYDNETIPQKTLPNNIYQRIVSVMKQSTQEYYNMRIVLGLESK